MTCAAAFRWSAGAQHQHGQGDHHEDEMDVAAVDLLNGQSDEGKFVFHDDYPLIEFDAPENSCVGASKQASKD
jgi:hypothetical protein